MKTLHADPEIAELQATIPLRYDLADLPLHDDPIIAKEQVYMRSALAIPLFQSLPFSKQLHNLKTRLLKIIR